MKINNNKLLITGGASGIGFGLAERFISEGKQNISHGFSIKMSEAGQEMLQVIFNQMNSKNK